MWKGQIAEFKVHLIEEIQQKHCIPVHMNRQPTFEKPVPSAQ